MFVVIGDIETLMRIKDNGRSAGLTQVSCKEILYMCFLCLYVLANEEGCTLKVIEVCRNK